MDSNCIFCGKMKIGVCHNMPACGPCRGLLKTYGYFVRENGKVIVKVTKTGKKEYPHLPVITREEIAETKNMILK